MEKEITLQIAASALARRDFKSRAAARGLTMKAAAVEAINDWLQKTAKDKGGSRIASEPGRTSSKRLFYL